MTPKEKAIKIVNKYLQIYDGKVNIAKKCALVSVDEILEFIDNSDFINLFWLNYWHEIKQEIEKL
jgi:hypothetical protein